MPYVNHIVYFDNEVNTSLQAKAENTASNTSNFDTGAWDIIYYVNTSSNKQVGEPILLGECIAISNDRKNITIRILDTIPLPGYYSYFMFAKNNKVNTSGLTGYYAEVEMKNDSTEEIELYAVNSEVVQSSK
tara:strand:+ start:27 stop:422 length:396 start_codon:yes stop_codon:yes gene_type:complete